MGTRKAVFLDRDGTVSHEVGYVNHERRLRLIPGSAAAIRKLNDAGLLAVLVTNQAGVARGYFEVSLVHVVHERLEALLDEEAGARLDGIYFCPHHPDVGQPHWRLECNCRKPRPGMLLQAATDLDIDLARSWLVSDHIKDVNMARAAGLTGVMVRTGYGAGLLEYHAYKWTTRPHHVTEDLAAAVDLILKLES
jgi:D-glycero-D-manno-heptose 1,7-bisphosphate phosphatase